VGSSSDVAREDHSLAWVALRRGDVQRARELFDASLTAQQQLGVQRGVAEGIAGLAATLWAAGDSERAVELLAFVDVQYDSLGAGVWPADHADMDRVLAGARTSLDPTTYQRAWARGQALTLSEVLVAARRASPPSRTASEHGDVRSTTL
jgi:hypothetical protein